MKKQKLLITLAGLVAVVGQIISALQESASWGLNTLTP